MVDNALTHSKQHELPTFSNVEIYYLPPNTTPYLQPLDQGIINFFKVSIINLYLKLSFSISINFFIKLNPNTENY